MTMVKPTKLAKARDLALLNSSAVREAIAECRTAKEAKGIDDKLVALERLARRSEVAREKLNVLGTLRIECRSTIGKLLPPPAKGGRGNKRADQSAGLGRHGERNCRALHRWGERRWRKWIKEEGDQGHEVTASPVETVALRDIAEKKREKKRQENAEKVADAQKPEDLVGLFTTIVIDPPWDWGDEGDVDQLGRARPDYATDKWPIEQIRKLPVAKLSASDAHLYLWITNRSLPKGFTLLDAWGFRYVTMLTWAKPSFGMGNYFRGQTEHVLFGVRGSLSLKRKDVGTLFKTSRPRRKHSTKPPEFLELVESCSHGPYLEMFSRLERDGWTTWGEDS